MIGILRLILNSLIPFPTSRPPVVELMASVHHPPLYFDLLGDMYRPFTSDDKVWEFGIGATRREVEQERMARAGGAAWRPVDTNISNRGIPAMVYADLKFSGFFQMAPEVARVGSPTIN